jgi:glycosyltransferase involved in cell wall biosynthesis
VIPNASDPGDWKGLETIRPSRFQLCYTGAMYVEYRSPVLLFEALASLRAEGDAAAQAHAVFLGPATDHLMQEAHRCGVADLVEYGGVVPREQALIAQREASDLLIFLNMDSSSSFELGSKIIEYTRARRPVLAFGPRESALREHIARNSLGWFASNLEEAKQALREAYRRFVSGDVELPASSTIGFQARDLAKSFAEQLDAVT